MKLLLSVMLAVLSQQSLAEQCTYKSIEGAETTIKDTEEECVAFCQESSEDSVEPSHGEICYFANQSLEF
jgi:hypothetical protein